MPDPAAHHATTGPEIWESTRVTVTRTTGMTGLEWTPPAAPFFRLVLSKRAVWADGPRSRHQAMDDPLAYYVA
jgi:hypothetical protein